MKLEWILLALFLISMVSNLAKAMRNPMLKNFLRLISILVAFIITFILQICGVFQNLAAKWVEDIDFSAIAPKFSGAIGNSISLLLPFCTTLISPLLFVLTFAIILWILKLVHVNLVYKFIVKRKRKKEIKEFKAALKEEKMMLKRALAENEARFASILESIALANPTMDVYNYDSLDEDEIDRMVEQRIKLERKKKKKKKISFFKESSERRAMSLVCGVVCGFLLFGITWMGFFYTMDFVSDVTSVVYETNAQDTKVYQIVEMIDEHIVTPYEESFVYKLYDSMAIVDLMKYTVEAGGKIEGNPGYDSADEMMRSYTKSAIRLACELTADTTKYTEEQLAAHVKNIESDIGNLTNEDSVMIIILAEFIVEFAEDFDTTDVNPDDIGKVLLASIVGNYQGDGNKDRVLQDLGAMSDIVVVAARNKLLSKIIEDNTLSLVINDQRMVADLAKAMSHLSFYPSTMNTAFTTGVNAFGSTLMPENAAAGYELFINNIVKAAGDVTSISDDELSDFYIFLKAAAEYKKNDGKIEYLNLQIEELQNTEGDLKEEDQATLDNLIAKRDDLVAQQDTQANIVDYLFDPLYVVELIAQDLEDLDLQAQYDEFTAEANRLEAEVNDLKEIIQGLLNGTIVPDETMDLETMQQREQALNIQITDFRNRAEALNARIQFLADEAKIYAEEFTDRMKGLAPFISYFMNWTNVQKPFMIANEDNTTACLALTLEGVTYVCSTDVLSIESLLDVLLDGGFENLGDITNIGGTEGDTDDGDGEGSEEDNEHEIFDVKVDDYLSKLPMRDLLEQLIVTNDKSTMSGRYSELTDLINFIILSANAAKASEIEINSGWLYEQLGEYCNCRDEACLVCRIVAAQDPESDDYREFVYNGVTVEQLKNTFNFGLKEDQVWTLEQREADSEELVAIIYTLLDLADKMNKDDESEEATSSETAVLLELLVSVGASMDNMANTTCLVSLPRVLLEGILKNDMLSMAMTPSMLYGESGYISRVDKGEITYADLMQEIADTANKVLEKLDKNEDEGSDDVVEDNGEENTGNEEEAGQ